MTVDCLSVNVSTQAIEEQIPIVTGIQNFVIAVAIIYPIVFLLPKKF